MNDGKIYQRGGGHQALDQKTPAWPTIREIREKALQVYTPPLEEANDLDKT